MGVRVLHVLDAPHGGATVGALDLIRFSARAGDALEHFAVYPGLGSTPDPRLNLFCQDTRPVPMRWWHIKPGLGRLERARIWWREMRATSFGRRTRWSLEACIAEWRIDLVHTNTSAILAGAQAARRLGLPHVWHIRERIGSDGIFRFPLDDRALAERIASLADVVVPASRFAGEIFSPTRNERVRVIYDGLDVCDFESDDARAAGRRLRRAWGVPDDALLIGNVGGLAHRVKRHDVFIRAAALLARRHPALRFAAIGVLPRATFERARASDPYFASLCNLVRQGGLEGRFHWVPIVPDSAAVMNAVDVLAHACDVDGFGRVAIEAMAAARPVVAPARGGLAESVVDGVTGFLVPPADPEALAGALDRLVGSPELRVRLGHAGRARVLERFSSAVYLEQMRDVYRLAMTQARP